MTTGVTPETFKSVSITENCYSHTIRLDIKLLPEISKSIIDIHESNVVTKNGGNGEIYNFNIQDQKVCVTLYLNGTIHVQGPAHKLWVQTNLLVILESCKNKLEEIESPKNKTSRFWKKIASAIKSPFCKKSPSLNPLSICMDSDEKDSIRQYFISQPSTPKIPEQEILTSTPITLSSPDLSVLFLNEEGSGISSLLLHGAIHSLKSSLDNLSIPTRNLLSHTDQVFNNKLSTSDDLDILTDIVRQLTERLDKLESEQKKHAVS